MGVGVDSPPVVNYTHDAEHRPYFTPEQAVAIVRENGVMLEAARGPAPSFASAAAGEDVPGNWWGHPKRYVIFDAIEAVRDSDEGAAEVLVCRLIGGKVTYVHRRLWPALVRLADRFDPERLAWLHEVHTEGGAHRVDSEPFPDWVPSDVRVAAEGLSEEEAEGLLGEVVAGLV